MKHRLILIILALTLLLPAACPGPAAAEDLEDWLGRPMPDFTVSTADGGRFSLSEALQTKKAVLVNFWATWCNPCAMEFPYMEEAYQLYGDRVEIIALSVEEADTDEVIRAFAQEAGISFLMASDTEAGLGGLFAENGIPTSVLVDRYGNIALIEVGAQTRVDAFSNAFDLLLGDDYTQTVTMQGFPGTKSDIAPVADGQLAAAAGDPPFRVASSSDPFAWPFLPAQCAGRTCLTASNVGRTFTYSEVRLEIDSQAGDVFAFDAALSTQGFYERLAVSLNGEKIRTFSGQADWFSYAVALREGANTVTLRYDKNIEYYSDEPNRDECVLLSDFRLLSGAEGARALAANPVFAFAEETGIAVTSSGAREVCFSDGDGSDTLEQLYGPNTRAYIANGAEVRCVAALSAEYDPDEAFLTENCAGGLYTAYDFQNTPLTIPLNSADTTGLTSTLILMYYTQDSRIANLVVFDSEESADAFCERMRNRGIETGWSYKNEQADAGGPLPESVTYTVRFTDQNGDPVPGCVINFCTDEMCAPAVANQSGVAVFTGAPYTYHLQVIRVPKGYSFDTAQEFTAPLLGGELSFTVEKQ